MVVICYDHTRCVHQNDDLPYMYRDDLPYRDDVPYRGVNVAPTVKRTRDEAVQFCYGCSFLSMKSVWTAPRVQFDPGFGVGIGGASCLVALTLKP